MPKATAPTESKKFDLKSCEGGFVCLRTMTFGEKLARRGFTSKALMRGGRGQRKGDFEAEMDLLNEQSQIFSFAHCITDHNLEDEDGNRLNLSAEGDIKKLHPQIGEEIDKLIDDMNNFDDEEDGGPSY
jgi:hypothetical protein